MVAGRQSQLHPVYITCYLKVVNKDRFKYLDSFSETWCNYLICSTVKFYYSNIFAIKPHYKFIKINLIPTFWCHRPC